MHETGTSCDIFQQAAFHTSLNGFPSMAARASLLVTKQRSVHRFTCQMFQGVHVPLNLAEEKCYGVPPSTLASCHSFQPSRVAALHD